MPASREFVRKSRRATFDGNRTDDIDRLWPLRTELGEDYSEQFSDLLDWVVNRDRLDWVLVPVNGYRV